MMATASKIKISSYNCRGLGLGSKVSSPRNFVIRDLMNLTDIVCIQEHWLYKQDLGQLNTFSPNFHGAGVSTKDTSKGIITSHPPGGVAIFWNINLESKVKVLNFDLDWVVGINLTYQSGSIVILNCYLPCQTAEHEEEFLLKCTQLLSIVNDLECPNIYIVGDFNANVSDSNSVFGNHLKNLCNDHNIINATFSKLPHDSFTFISDIWHTVSWLDHCLCTPAAYNLVANIKIEYGLITSDHVPFTFSIQADEMPQTCTQSLENGPRCVNWSRTTDRERWIYNVNSGSLLESIQVPFESLYCNNINCTNASHLKNIEKYYNDIVQSLKDSSDFLIKNPSSTRVSVNRPGWNDIAKEVYEESKEAFMDWKNAGRPRHGPIFDIKKRAQARFKYAMRYLKLNEEQIRKNNLAEKLVGGDPRDFWQDVKKLSSSNNVLPSTIEGTTGTQAIANLWKHHYEQIFNCVPSNNNFNYSLEDVNNIEIASDEIKANLHKLDNNKASGPDGIAAEHLKLCSDSILNTLADCFKSFFIHGYLPQSMLGVNLSPICKDSKGDLSSLKNYRPIAIATILSKVFEMCILRRLISYVNSSDNQFGYKKALGTDTGIYILKELLLKYHNLDSNVFLCFLDASKAFDRVNHGKLFCKLITKDVPGYLVRILIYWYANQFMKVKWANCFSSSFKISNGVRQGSVLSPFLFNFYLDGLSDRLSTQSIGCSNGGQIINHIIYADDIVLLSPSVKGMDKLLSICENYALEFDILFNPTKSVSMYIRAKNAPIFPHFRLNNTPLTEVDSVKYLGHYISHDLTDDADIQRQIRCLYAQGNNLIRKFHMCSKNVKVTLFRTYCTPLYTAHLWTKYKASTFHKIKVAYNTIFRLLLGVPRFSNGINYSASQLFVENNLPTFEALLRKLSHTFMSRILSSENKLMKSVVSTTCSDLTFISPIWRYWRSRLHIIGGGMYLDT